MALSLLAPVSPFFDSFSISRGFQASLHLQSETDASLRKAGFKPISTHLRVRTQRNQGLPHNVRLYSIASTRYGDSFDGKTASLCVRRAVYYDPETGKEDPSKDGVCSNFLCEAKSGDKVQLTGPSGKVMLLPEDDPSGTHIMIATEQELLLSVATSDECLWSRYDKALSRNRRTRTEERWMMPGIQETLKRVAEQREKVGFEKLGQLKKNKQWHVEVY
ncbi:hypothetical protein HPP92_016946 [Vanilla planifolia]|uniref:ferredoxin--NADP(+) reductase n=1 Tax=Vanilla planifolia TaxID=51239 RepID=A0A835QFR0_VANPL|nr:hypothetical protein HPP92_016946 [Vanilla planifolia]